MMISATTATAIRLRPARRNQSSNDRSNVSNPTSPLDEPVKVPPD